MLKHWLLYLYFTTK